MLHQLRHLVPDGRRACRAGHRRASLALNFTNEIGVGGRIRFLKNIAGLWLLQECRRAWALEGTEYTYDELARLASACAPFKAIIDPDAFLHAGGMPGRIAAWCGSTGQTAPDTPGEFARAILESLALRYRQVLESLELAVSGVRSRSSTSWAAVRATGS